MKSQNQMFGGVVGGFLFQINHIVEEYSFFDDGVVVVVGEKVSDTVRVDEAGVFVKA